MDGPVRDCVVTSQALFMPAQDSHFGAARSPLARIRRSEQRKRLCTGGCRKMCDATVITEIQITAAEQCRHFCQLQVTLLSGRKRSAP